MEEATYRGTVYPWQCDHVGHMNIMWYAGKFDEANWNFFARLGLTPSYLRTSGRGMAAVQQNISYRRELLARATSSISGVLCLRSAKNRSASCTRCATWKPASSQLPARSPPCTWIASFASPPRSRMRSAPSRCSTSSYQNRPRPDAMTRFEPKNPDFRRMAADTFARQQAMRTLGISIARLEAGEVDLAMDYSPDFTQQNGFIHAGVITAGLDNACGMAAFTLMPAGADILTVEFKTNLLAPASGERFVFRATVVKAGRTLTICDARAYAIRAGAEHLVATMTGTLMALQPRDPAKSQDRVPATAN